MTFASAQLADSPAIRYGLGEALASTSVADDSGNGRDGTVLTTLYSGAPSSVTWQQASLVGGGDTAVRLGTSTPGSAGGILTPSVGPNAAFFFEFVVQALLSSWEFSIEMRSGSTDVFKFKIGSAAGVAGFGVRATHYDASPITTPHDLTVRSRLHVAVGLDASGIPHCYVDGVEVEGGDYSALTLRTETTAATIELSGVACVVDEFAYYDHSVTLSRFQAHLSEITNTTTAAIALPRLTAVTDIIAPPVMAAALAFPAWTSSTAIDVARSTWISVHTADPGAIGADEATGGAYERAQTMWTDDGGSSSGTFVTIDLPAGTYTHFGVWPTAAAGGFDSGGVLSSFTLGSGGWVTLDVSAVDGGDGTLVYSASVVDFAEYPPAETEPDVEPVPSNLTTAPDQARIIAKIIDTPEVRLPSYEQATSRVASVDMPLDRLVVNGVDLTYVDGVPFVLEGYKLIDPLLYGSATVVIPAINPLFGHPDFGANATELRDYFNRARIRLDRVSSSTVQARDFKGFVTRVDCEDTVLRLEVAGEASGALSMMYVPPAVYRRKQDVEHICVDLLRDARVNAHEHAGASGVGLIRRGGSDGLSIFNETLAVWAGATGQWITFTPNADGDYRKIQKPDADDPIDFTAYPSDLVSVSIAWDATEEYDRIYLHGFTPQGELVTNIKVPGITQGTPPAFPGTVMLGDTGDPVIVIQYQLALHNFLDLNDCQIGTFDDATADAVTKFKRDAGLSSLTPEVGSPAWDALWNLGDLGYTLDDAREYPEAQDPRTRKWNRAANGARIELNPDYDQTYVPNDLFVDAGGPFSKERLHFFAVSKLAPPEGIWTGTLTLRSGLWSGDVAPADTVNAGMVADRRDVQPNARVRIPWFGGDQAGIVVYVSGCDHGPDQSQLLVSTAPTTTMETWQAIERRREAKSNPGRAWSGHVRASQVRNDRDRQWDTTGGRIGNDVDLVEGWNEVVVPVGQGGIVNIVHTQLEDPAEYALMLTQRRVAGESKEDAEAALNGNTHTATPLVDPRPSARPWWEQTTVVDWLNGRGLLDAWGTPKQPCGYDPALKTDENGPTAQPLTGEFKESAGLNYETHVQPVLYLYIWVESANTLKKGRILYKQDTRDF